MAFDINKLPPNKRAFLEYYQSKKDAAMKQKQAASSKSEGGGLPVSEAEVDPNLRNFLSVYRSGYNVLPPGMFDEQNLLKGLQKYNPNANLTESEMYGGEGGSGPLGYKLNVDLNELPQIMGGKYGSLQDWAVVDENTNVKNDKFVYNDPVYGKVTLAKNIQQAKDPLWTKLAPLAVGVAAPWAAAGLAGAGIGGAAGLTSSVTGSGLGAGAGGWLGSAINSGVKGLPGMAKGASQGNIQGLGSAALGFVPGMQSVAKWLPLLQAAYAYKKGKK